MDIPQSEAEARRHVDKIRDSKGLDGPASKTSDLENALVILSEQLYQKSTHFLLELIQNADDNSYKVPNPTLHITIRDRTIRIDCNEIGFSKQNMEAICKIGASTKSGSNKATGYIGEKGIGFKSVFKIADAVWIHSGHYSIKFDKHVRLGMLVPEWSSFPDPPLAGYTSMYLQLTADCDMDELFNDIKTLDTRLLIFLRKLRQLDVDIFQGEANVWSSKLGRSDKNSKESASVISLQHNSDSLLYRTIRFPVSNLPADAKRPGCSDSEVLLAFPLNHKGEPLVTTQNVYAFLPIRNYGFKFLMQADFLLIASREDIDSSSSWNHALLRAIPKAFCQAVDDFNLGDLRYSWMRYLAKRPLLPDFFGNLESSITLELSHAPILESLGGQLMAPTGLRYVPSMFCNADKTPLIQSRMTTARYISPKYDFERDKAELLQLGVRELMPAEFIVDLKKFIEDSPNQFRGMTQSWHSSLCKALFRLIHDFPRLKSEIVQLDIVPLKDGRWISPGGRKMCFSENDTAPNIPRGISLVEIDPKVTSDPTRRGLYVFLGAQSFSSDMVCDAIISTHMQQSFRPELLSRSDLIEHVAFLYHAGWKNFNNGFVWLSTESGRMVRSCETYINSTRPYSASTMFQGNDENISFICKEYFEDIFTDDESLTKWLIDSLLLAEFPRLVDPRATKLSLSAEFQFLLQSEDYLSVLLLLRNHWKLYEKWIIPDEDSANEVKKAQLRNGIANMSVKCRDGGYARLKETVLPLKNMMAESLTPLKFIDIPDPENTQWQYLSYLGVVVNAGIGPFIQSLQLLKESDCTLQQVSILYEQIHLHSSGHESSVRKAFSTDYLIYIPKYRGQSRKNWIKLDECIWEGPRCLKKTPRIQDFYPRLLHFFCHTLELRRADWTTLMGEVQSIEAFDDIDYISEIFISISDYLQGTQISESEPKRKEMIAELIESSVFPINEGKSEATFDYLSSARNIDKWFIADRVHLKRSFDGLVPLLAFKSEVASKITVLIKELGLERRLLSRLAQGIPQTGGKTQLHFEYTKAMCAKARYIARLLPADLVNREAIIEQLCNSKAYTSERVSINWTLKLPDGQETVGRADSGRVKVTPVGKSLEIYFRKDDSNILRPPLELVEELTTICGISDASHLNLLNFVISEPELDEIDSVFHRKGLQNDAPELEALVEAVNRGHNPQFWETDMEHGKKRWKDRAHPGRPFKKPPKNKDLERNTASLDAVQSFMRRFNDSTHWTDVSTKPLTEVNTDAMLSHFSRLEARDPYSLLPREGRNMDWGARLRKGGAFPNDAVAMIFRDDPTLHKKDRFLRPAQCFPATVEVTRRKGVKIVISPNPQLEVPGEVIFAGEVYVSKLLEKEMGKAYRPGIHWTSSCRARFGLDPFKGNEREASTFTIEDSAGSAAFTQMLVRKGHKPASSWPKALAYHIEVSTTEGGILSEFTMEPYQVTKAWLCHQDMARQVRDVFVLIRISDARGRPDVAMFVDPWQLHAEGKLRLVAESRHLAEFESTPPYIPLGESANQLNNETPSKQRRSGIFTSKKPEPTVSISPGGGFYAYGTLKLNEIRLLELYPGPEDAPIEGKIVHTPVNNTQGFSAISYVWGPTLQPFHLQTAEGKVSLTASLYSALKRFRRPDEPVFLWADAICINQSNDHEKAIQIRLLPTIFQSAETVFAWVGEDEDNSHEALQTLMQIRTEAISPDEWPEELPPLPYGWHDGMPRPNNPIWRDIAALFERDWFKRAWIIQETVLASDLEFICGAWKIDWDDIFSAIEICLDWAERLEASHARTKEIVSVLRPAYVLGYTRQVFKEMKYSPRFNLLALLDEFAHTESTRLCDKLFALLGIASDAKSDAFDPDYQSSIETIVRRYATEFVRRGNGIDLLYRAGLAKSYEFASWIPNWTSAEPCRTISTWRGANGIFTAGGSEASNIQILLTQGQKLKVSGMLVDKITRIGSISMLDHDVISVIKSIRDIISEIRSYPTGETREELRLRVPIGNAMEPCSDAIGTLEAEEVSDSGQDPSTDEDDSFEERFNWEDSNMDVNTMQDMVEFLKQDRGTRDLGWKYWYTAAAFMKRLSGGRFCMTERGYIGIAPFQARAGDRIAVFHSGAVPFILRPKGYDSKAPHELVGECYIHGIMYGEALDFHDVKRQDIIIQ